VIVVAFFYATGQEGVPFASAESVDRGGKLFSNFLRSLSFAALFAALAAAIGFWPAAIVSSVAFGATHTQYPLSLQALIAVTAMLWAWVTQRTGDLMAPYLAHMTLDLVVDPIL
jgi:membrane protease YdiL (CAAX protease family)